MLASSVNGYAYDGVAAAMMRSGSCTIVTSLKTSSPPETKDLRFKQFVFRETTPVEKLEVADHGEGGLEIILRSFEEGGVQIVGFPA
jgi:hypothetical protein